MQKEGFMRCVDCGMLWKGMWNNDGDVTCPECQSPLEKVEKDELRET